MDPTLSLGAIFTALTGAISLLFRELLKAERDKCVIWKDLFDKERVEKREVQGRLDTLIGTTAGLTSTLNDVSASVKHIYEDMRLDGRDKPPATRTTRNPR